MCVWTTTDKHKYSILLQLVVKLYSDYCMSSVSFSYTFSFYIALLKEPEPFISCDCCSSCCTFHNKPSGISKPESCHGSTIGHSPDAPNTGKATTFWGIAPLNTVMCYPPRQMWHPSGVGDESGVFILPCVAIFVPRGITGPQFKWDLRAPICPAAKQNVQKWRH